MTNILTIIRELVSDRDKEVFNDDITRTDDIGERSRGTKRRINDSFSSQRLKDTRPRGGEEGYDGDGERSREINDNESSTGEESLKIETMSRRP